MSNINLLVLFEQRQTNLNNKITTLNQQRDHLNSLFPTHHQNVVNHLNNQNNNQNQNTNIKIISPPHPKDVKLANHFDKMAHKLVNFRKTILHPV